MEHFKMENSLQLTLTATVVLILNPVFLGFNGDKET